MALIERLESERGESFPRIENQFLSQFEQKLIGGSVEGFDVAEELFQNNNGLPGSRVRPDSLRSGESIDATNKARANGYLVGPITIYGISSLSIPDRFLEITRLPLADPSTGIPPQEWITFLLDQEAERVFNDPHLLLRLVLSGRIGSNMISWIEKDGVHAGFKPKS